MPLELIDEGATAALPDFRRAGSFDSMYKLGYYNRGNCDLNLTETLPNRIEKVLYRLVLSFGFDNITGIEDQSQDGGFHACWRSLTPSSTSGAKPLSRVTREPLAFAEAMHSEMDRPDRSGERIKATGAMILLDDYFDTVTNLFQHGGEVVVTSVSDIWTVAKSSIIAAPCCPGSQRPA